MNNDIFSISLSLLKGEEISLENQKRLWDYNTKYELVRFLYKEKINNNTNENEPQLKDFHFSPGTDFENIPAIDIVNSLLKLDDDIKTGKKVPERLNFGDRKWNNPPVTGRKKTRIGD